MDQRTAINIVRKYSDLVVKHFPVRKVLLYGSYAKGNQRRDSDIDVAVIVDDLNEDYFMSKVELFKLRRSIDERIEPILIEQSDQSGFLEDILKHAYVVHENNEHPIAEA